MRRKGFERGFDGPRVLIPRGVSVAQMRLRASYIEKPLAFQHIVQAIIVPKGAERRAKLLTALLNSKVAIWYAFHGTASFGSDRPEVQQAELMRLPFPEPSDMPEPHRALKAEKALVATIDRAMALADEFVLQGDASNVLPKLDQMAYEYFCLSADEVALIEDEVSYIFPAVQPHQGSFPAIWKPVQESERQVYAETLVGALSAWFGSDNSINVRLEACNADLAVLRLTLGNQNVGSAYMERQQAAVREVLGRLFENVHERIPGNFQLMPDFRLFDGDDLYLIKPMQKRFWLRSSALADAGAIALDLQDYASARKIQGSA